MSSVAKNFENNCKYFADVMKYFENNFKIETLCFKYFTISTELNLTTTSSIKIYKYQYAHKYNLKNSFFLVIISNANLYFEIF